VTQKETLSLKREEVRKKLTDRQDLLIIMKQPLISTFKHCNSNHS